MSHVITDEFMQRTLPLAREYVLVILRKGARLDADDVRPIIWEHARKNFALRAQGKLPIVCPGTDASDVKGIGIFDCSMDEVARIMDEDPGVQAHIFLYELHPCKSFPGDALPK
jgi:hypothetical protein